MVQIDYRSEKPLQKLQNEYVRNADGSDGLASLIKIVDF